MQTKMEPTVPDWMDEDFFQQSLRKEEGNDNIVVNSLSVTSAVPPGNNYGSFIIRAALDWKTNENDAKVHSSKFIVKAELIEGPMKEMTTDMALNEPSFYYRFIPRAKEFADPTFAAKSFFSPKPTVTILEDLKENGFIMVDRTKQLDFDHCRLYMKAAALFHSVSVPVFKNYPELLEPINKETMFANESKSKDVFTKMINGGVKRFVEEIEKMDRFKKYSKTLKELKPHLWDKLVEAHKPSNKGVNTIKQGDPWTTNMMFKYDKMGKVCDIKIIDFQGTGYNSPVTDLMLFIWSSATLDVKKRNLDELYRIYLENFNGNLKRFNCSERLTYEQMMEEVKKLSPLAIFTSSCFLPCLVNPEPMDLSVFVSNESEDAMDKFYDKFYDESYCKNYLPHVFETLEINGVFAYLEESK